MRQLGAELSGNPHHGSFRYCVARHFQYFTRYTLISVTSSRYLNRCDFFMMPPFQHHHHAEFAAGSRHGSDYLRALRRAAQHGGHSRVFRFTFDASNTVLAGSGRHPLVQAVAAGPWLFHD